MRHDFMQYGYKILENKKKTLFPMKNSGKLGEILKLLENSGKIMKIEKPLENLA